jgi:hypothetical protein
MQAAPDSGRATHMVRRLQLALFDLGFHELLQGLIWAGVDEISFSRLDLRKADQLVRELEDLATELAGHAIDRRTGRPAPVESSPRSFDRWLTSRGRRSKRPPRSRRCRGWSRTGRRPWMSTMSKTWPSRSCAPCWMGR